MSTGELGVWLAVATSVGGSLGTWMGGYVASRYAAADEPKQARLLAVSAALITPLVAAILLIPSKDVALSLLLPAYALMFFSFGPSFSMVQGLAVPRMRATITAFVIMGQVLLAGIFGLQIVGILSDVLAPQLGVHSLRWAMVAVCVVALWAAFHFLQSARFIRDDLIELSDAELPQPSRTE